VHNAHIIYQRVDSYRLCRLGCLRIRVCWAQASRIIILYTYIHIYMFHFCLRIWVIPKSLLAEVIYIIYLSTRLQHMKKKAQCLMNMLPQTNHGLTVSTVLPKMTITRMTHSHKTLQLPKCALPLSNILFEFEVPKDTKFFICLLILIPS